MGGGDGGGDFVAGAELVAGSADEELGNCAIGEKFVAVVTAFGVNGESEGDGSFDAEVGTNNAQADVGAEGESGEENRQAEILVEPVESGADVVLLAASVIVPALAEACSAKVEAKDGKAKGVKGLHGMVDDLVVHGSSAERMRVTEEDGVFRAWQAGVEQSLEASDRAGEVIDGAEGGGEVLHRGPILDCKSEI